MLNQSNRAQALIERFLSGNIRPEEVQELTALATGLDNEALAELLKGAWEAHAMAEPIFSVSETETMLQQILSKEKKQTKVARLPRRSWISIAAALLFLVVMAGLYILINRPDNNAGQALEPGAHAIDIPPGGNIAVLTMADGTAIALDGAPSGLLSRQGNIQVIKIGDGQLAYEAKGSPKEVIYHTISTPRGGQYQLTLSDGTQIWLNSASSIQFPVAFTGNERKVTMTGEAYFEVAKNSAKPFKVNVADQFEVEVLGTKFNVNAYRDEATLNATLIEGSVKISRRIGETAVLKPGQQAMISQQLQVVDLSDTEEVTAWKSGWFVFNRSDLEGIMRQISRWYDVEVEFEGTMRNRSFSGMVSRANNVSEVLKIMENAGVRFRIETGKIVVIQ